MPNWRTCEACGSQNTVQSEHVKDNGVSLDVVRCTDCGHVEVLT